MNWLREEGERARKRSKQVPAWARPIYLGGPKRTKKCRITEEWDGPLIGRRHCFTHDKKWDDGGDCPAMRKIEQEPKKIRSEVYILGEDRARVIRLPDGTVIGVEIWKAPNFFHTSAMDKEAFKNFYEGTDDGE